MQSDKNTPRFLGAAFLLQAIASLAGYSLLENLVTTTGIIDTMTNISNHEFQLRASIVFQLITAIGVVMLGAMLFITLRKQNQNIALTALGLYIL